MQVICLAAGVETNGGVAELDGLAGAGCRGERGCREWLMLAGCALGEGVCVVEVGKRLCSMRIYICSVDMHHRRIRHVRLPAAVVFQGTATLCLLQQLLMIP